MRNWRGWSRNRTDRAKWLCHDFVEASDQARARYKRSARWKGLGARAGICVEVAEARGLPKAQVALAWLLENR